MVIKKIVIMITPELQMKILINIIKKKIKKII